MPLSRIHWLARNANAVGPAYCGTGDGFCAGAVVFPPELLRPKFRTRKRNSPAGTLPVNIPPETLTKLTASYPPEPLPFPAVVACRERFGEMLKNYAWAA
jgi:hypothetical protein